MLAKNTFEETKTEKVGSTEAASQHLLNPH